MTDVFANELLVQMREEELLVAKHVGEVMKILSDVTHSAYDPDELLKVGNFCFPAW